MDPDDLARRLEALHRDAFGWAAACCGGDAEFGRETLQVAYVKVLEGRAKFDGRSSLKTWFFGVIRRTAGEQRRSRRLAALGLERFRLQTVDPAPPEPPIVAAERSETAERLRGALARLSGRQREVLHLVFYQGLTVDEAGAVIGISPGSARLHFARGKHRLRQLLPEGVTS